MPPNVIVIYADDLGWGDLGSFGADDMATPVLDRLASSGVRLPEWYSNSPVCSPSRASLLTGKYPAHAGVESILGGTRHTPGLPPQATIASELRDRGYRTGLFGKWHLGASADYAPTNYGFDETFGFRAGCVDYYSHIYYWGDHDPIHDLWEDDREVWLNGEYLTTAIGRRASEFIERCADRDEPFFCYVPFNAPHYPLHAPQEYMDRFAHLPDDRRAMAAMIAAMDDAVGVILDALDRAGARANTIVFMSSDNGPSAESRNWLDGEEISYRGGSAGGLRGTKGSLFEGGIRVPAMISWPGMLPEGAEFDGVGAMMDLLPTILEAAGAGTADGVDGRSLLGELMAAGTSEAAAGAEEERAVFWEHDGQWAVRRGRYKRVRNVQEGMTPPAAVDQALYDLDADAPETADIAARLPDVAARLDADLDAFARRRASWADSRAHTVA